MASVVTPQTIAASDFNVTASALSEYNSATAYTTGNQVKVSFESDGTTPRTPVYEYEAAGSTTGNYPPDDDGTNWTLIGASNRWKMFDAYVSSQTTNTDTIEVTLTVTKADRLYLLNLDAYSVTIVCAEADTTPISSETVDLTDTDSGSWSEYFFGHVYQNYQAQIRLTTKLKFLTGIAHKITEAIGTTNMPPVVTQLGVLAARVGMVEAALNGMEATGRSVNGYWVPNRHQLYSSQVVTQALYPDVIKAIRELAGGALIMLPSSAEDMFNPELAGIISKTQISGAFDPEGKVKLLKAAWDAVGSEFGSRHTQYEMFYAGAQFVTAGHSFRTYDWDEAGRLVNDLLSSYSREDERPAGADSDVAAE